MLFEQLYHKHHSNNPAEDLIKAAANGDVQKLEEMLSKGTCHVSFSDVMQTENFVFCICGILFLWVHLTITVQCSLQVNDVYVGHTALQAASQNGQSDVIKLLIGYKADLEQEVMILSLS